MLKTKILKRMPVLFLIGAFSIAGIIACSADVTEPNASQPSVTIPDNTGPVTPGDTNTSPEPEPTPVPEPEPTPDPEPEPSQPTFPEDTYLKIYVPWGKTLQADRYITTVSYQDTNTLNQLWKAFIECEKDNNGKRWIIRDGDNRQTDPLTGNYYYFDKNFDIFHSYQRISSTEIYGHVIKVKEFVGGVIVKYSGGRQDFAGKVWTIGGLYKTVLNKEKYNSKEQQGYTKYNNNNLNEFMRAVHRWEEGDLSVILMNVGYAFGNDEYGVDQYYCTADNNYRKNPSYFLGVDPNKYLGTDLNGYRNEKLNVRVNHSSNTSKFNFKFVSVDPYAWHLR